MSKDALRAHRKALVIEAEAVMKAYFGGSYPAGARERKELGKTQLSQLIGVCAEAACEEEIANYLRYQVARDVGWRSAMVDPLIKGARKVTSTLADDELRVQAWQRYATYLSRAFTYHDAIAKDRDNSAKGDRR